MHFRRLLLTTIACSACAAADSNGTSASKTYTGPFTAQVVESTVSTSLTGGGTFPCTNSYTMSGTLTVTINDATSGTLGVAQVSGTQVETGHSSAANCLAKGNLNIAWAPKLTGTTADLRFDDSSVATNSG